jgi:hypothetical protein
MSNVTLRGNPCFVGFLLVAGTISCSEGVRGNLLCRLIRRGLSVYLYAFLSTGRRQDLCRQC